MTDQSLTRRREAGFRCPPLDSGIRDPWIAPRVWGNKPAPDLVADVVLHTGHAGCYSLDQLRAAWWHTADREARRHIEAAARAVPA